MNLKFVSYLLFQNLTEFNTAHNRRSVTLAEIKDAKNPVKRKIKNMRISFHEEDEVINPGLSCFILLREIFKD